jgi:hypothetical protein
LQNVPAPAPDKLRTRDGAIHSLRLCLIDGGFALDKVPGLVRRILADESWRDRKLMATGERVTFKSFEAFVEAKPLEGLGSTIHQLKQCCRDDLKVLDAIDRVVQHPRGRPAINVDNIHNSSRQAGTSISAALRRLRTHRPDLHKRVLAKDLSPHAAMVKAGLRHQTATFAIDDVQALAGALKRRLGKRWRAFCAAVDGVR